MCLCLLISFVGVDDIDACDLFLFCILQEALDKYQCSP